MENSPGRELRARLKPSPSSSPSSHHTQGTGPLPNGAFQGKPKDDSMKRPFLSKLSSTPQSLLMMGKSIPSPTRNNIPGNGPRANAAMGSPKYLQLSNEIKTVDINSNTHNYDSLSVFTGGNVNLQPSKSPQNIVPSSNNKRSRKQRSPRRAKTATMSPNLDGVPELWEDPVKLELTPNKKRKRYPQTSYIAWNDSSGDEIIDLTHEGKRLAQRGLQGQSEKSFASFMNRKRETTIKRELRGNSRINTSESETDSPRAKRVRVTSPQVRSSPRSRKNCPSPSQIIDLTVKTGNPTRATNVPVQIDCTAIQQQNSIVENKTVLRTSPRQSPKKSNTPGQSPEKSDNEYPLNLTTSKGNFASKLVMNGKRSPNKSPVSPKRDKNISPNKSPVLEQKSKNRSPSQSSEKSYKIISPNFKCGKDQPPKTNNFIESFMNFVSKSSTSISNVLGNATQTSCQGDQATTEENSLENTGSVSSKLENPNKKIIYEINKSCTSASIKQVSQGQNEKVKVDNSIKVKVDPPTPTVENDPQSSKDRYDDTLLHPLKNQQKPERKIVKAKKTVGRQRKSSGGNRRGSTGRGKKVVPLSPCKFQPGHEVLARWYDGLFYLGSVIKVDERGKKCYVRFEDDSEYWILFKDLQKGAKDGDLSCCLCQTDSSDKPNEIVLCDNCGLACDSKHTYFFVWPKPNEIVLCDNCGLGYHQECHNPNIGSEVLQPDVEWCCRLCVFAAAVKQGGALKSGPDAKALQKMKQTFPYDINKLTWDAQHKTNVEQCYCYCGGPGNWFLKMLQCCRCRQWFHEACIQCLEYPLMNGDRFYLFVCSHCNMGPEYMKRLDLKWVDVVHLTLYNLTIEGRWNKFYDVNTIVDFIKRNWEMLQIGCLEQEKDILEEKVVSALSGYKSRFTNLKENKRSKVSRHGYGLRVRIPPPAPTVMLPHTGQVNHEIMMSLKEKGKNFKCFVPSQCTSPVSMPWQSKQRGLNVDVSLAFKSDKVRRNLIQSGTETPPCKDYQSDSSQPPILRRDQHVLDDLIPVPSNFEGHNHPFKQFFEQEEEMAQRKRKTEIMNYLYMEYETDEVLSQSSVGSQEDLTTVIPTPPPSVSGNGKEVAKKSRKRGRKSDPEEPLRQSKRRRVTQSNVLDVQTIEKGVQSGPVSIAKIRKNMCQYFGASDRMRKGEKYNVLAKRVTSDGKIKYLMQWEGLYTK